ncbi:TIGR03668 family PPOX class F420-dependent oxidoreductase [Nakamurella sp. GG22]
MRIPADQARQIFGNARVARLATVGPALVPHLVPVTFAVITAPVEEVPAAHPDRPSSASQMIVFAVDHKPKSTSALRRLDNIAANPQVCFLVDRYDDDWEQLWWVRADARASVLEGTERRRALAALTVRYQQYEQVPPTGVVVGSTVTRWTGWRAARA